MAALSLTLKIDKIRYIHAKAVLDEIESLQEHAHYTTGIETDAAVDILDRLADWIMAKISEEEDESE